VSFTEYINRFIRRILRHVHVVGVVAHINTPCGKFLLLPPTNPMRFNCGTSQPYFEIIGENTGATLGATNAICDQYNYATERRLRRDFP
jgi:hypothetical protein